MEIKYFNALVQIVLSGQQKLFDQIPDRQTLLRNIFEKDILIPINEIDKDMIWGIGRTRYLTEDNKWLLGFLYRCVDASKVSTIPQDCKTPDEIKKLSGMIVNMTPFIFNFSTQHIYTQNNYSVTRTPKAAAAIWLKIISYQLRDYKNDINNIYVQPIPEKEEFWKQMEHIKVMNRAELELFGPNYLNEERIKSLYNDFGRPVDSQGLEIILKNYKEGLNKDAMEMLMLIKYILNGGGKGRFKGLDKDKNETTVYTEKKFENIPVQVKIIEESDQQEMAIILERIKTYEENRHETH
jgi:hypothetical protein